MGLKPTTNENKKQVKPFYRKWWFWVVLVIVIGAIASSNDTDVSKTNPNTTNQVQINADNEKTKDDTTSTNTIIEDIKEAIKDDIDSENEKITDVVLKEGTLSIFVDLTNADPSPLTMEDLAISRTSSITDAILELKDYDNEWREIVVDFGNIGRISNSKDNIKENEYGLRYFASENFVLEK